MSIQYCIYEKRKMLSQKKDSQKETILLKFKILEVKNFNERTGRENWENLTKRRAKNQRNTEALQREKKLAGQLEE